MKKQGFNKIEFVPYRTWSLYPCQKLEAAMRRIFLYLIPKARIVSRPEKN